MSYVHAGPNCKKCRNDLWEVVSDNEARCTNCHAPRPYLRRKRGTDITPSQQRAIDQIRAYFDGSRDSDDRMPRRELHKFDARISKAGDIGITGNIYVVVEDHANLLIMRGAHCMIGRRGGITIMSVRGIFSNDSARRAYQKHLAYMLKAKLWKNIN